MHARAVILLACLLLSANLVKHAWRMTCFSILKESITHYDANVLTSFGACSKIPFGNVNTNAFSIHGFFFRKRKHTNSFERADP